MENDNIEINKASTKTTSETIMKIDAALNCGEKDDFNGEIKLCYGVRERKYDRKYTAIALMSKYRKKNKVSQRSKTENDQTNVKRQMNFM